MKRCAFCPLLILAAGAAYGQTAPGIPSYEPITPSQRVHWLIKGTIGPANILGSLTSAGLGTWRDSPVEYGPHWTGYGKRFGLRISERAVANTIEVGMGSLWGEDPRYYRIADQPFRARVINVVRMTFVTHNREGHEMPAYARFISAPSSAFLANTWEPDSQHDLKDGLSRTGLVFAKRMAGNTLNEFWPDVRRRLRRGGGAGAQPSGANKPTSD